MRFTDTHGPASLDATQVARLTCLEQQAFQHHGAYVLAVTMDDHTHRRFMFDDERKRNYVANCILNARLNTP